MPASAERCVDDWELRCRFNCGKFDQRVTSEELRIVAGEPGDPAPESGQLPGTKSQTFYYYDKRTGEPVAKVHGFPLPSGGFGASGMVDPKRVLQKGRVFKQWRGPDRHRDPSLYLPGNPEVFTPSEWLWRYRYARKTCCKWCGVTVDRTIGEATTWVIRRLKSEKQPRKCGKGPSRW